MIVFFYISRQRLLYITEILLEGTSISIIIPTHRTGGPLNHCLQSVIDFGAGVKEVILVSDGISSTLIEFNLSTIPGLRLEALKENKGPAYARNHGARLAESDILLFLDSDVELLPDTIENVKRHFERPDAAAAIIGSYDAYPGETGLLSRYRNLLHHFTHQTSGEQVPTFWGACGAIRKDVFEQTGGFDTSYDQASIEDIEFGYRLSDQGYRICLDKRLQVKHLKSWTLKSMIKTDINLRARPWTRLLHQRKKLGSKELNLNTEERLATAFLLLGLTSLITSFFWQEALIPTLVLLISLAVVKSKIYRFFTSKFKVAQLPIVILLHWLYLLCAFTGFVLGTLDHLFSAWQPETDSKTGLTKSLPTGP
jgi:GT2 family glycosyltransferase